jgi:hypothetical protein
MRRTFGLRYGRTLEGRETNGHGVFLEYKKLTLRWMFETAVADGANQLRLEQEVAETSRVDADVGTFLVDIAAGGKLALLAVGGSGGLVAADLLVGVINEIFLLRHLEYLIS